MLSGLYHRDSLKTPSVFELRRRRNPVDISPLAKGEKPDMSPQGD